MNCSFESSYWESELSCGLSQMTNDNFDWTRYSGSSPSSSTGPSYASDGSYYLYIETSSNNNNANAVLISKTLNTGKYHTQWKNILLTGAYFRYCNNNFHAFFI